MPKATTIHITGELHLTDNHGGSVSARCSALLDAIDANGSIAAVARQLVISYRAAWEAVDAMNTM